MLDTVLSALCIILLTTTLRDRHYYDHFHSNVKQLRLRETYPLDRGHTADKFLLNLVCEPEQPGSGALKLDFVTFI